MIENNEISSEGNLSNMHDNNVTPRRKPFIDWLKTHVTE